MENKPIAREVVAALLDCDVAGISDNTKIKVVAVSDIRPLYEALKFYEQEAPHLCRSKINELGSAYWIGEDLPGPAKITREYPAKEVLSQFKHIFEVKDV